MSRADFRRAMESAAMPSVQGAEARMGGHARLAGRRELDWLFLMVDSNEAGLLYVIMFLVHKSQLP